MNFAVFSWALTWPMKSAISHHDKEIRDAAGWLVILTVVSLSVHQSLMAEEANDFEHVWKPRLIFWFCFSRRTDVIIFCSSVRFRLLKTDIILVVFFLSFAVCLKPRPLGCVNTREASDSRAPPLLGMVKRESPEAKAGSASFYPAS